MVFRSELLSSVFVMPMLFVINQAFKDSFLSHAASFNCKQMDIGTYSQNSLTFNQRFCQEPYNFLPQETQ